MSSLYNEASPTAGSAGAGRRTAPGAGLTRSLGARVRGARVRCRRPVSGCVAVPLAPWKYRWKHRSDPRPAPASQAARGSVLNSIGQDNTGHRVPALPCHAATKLQYSTPYMCSVSLLSLFPRSVHHGCAQKSLLSQYSHGRGEATPSRTLVLESPPAAERRGIDTAMTRSCSPSS